LREVRAVNRRYDPTLEAVRGGQELPSRGERKRTKALLSARTSLKAALELQPQRAAAVAPQLVDTLFALDERAAACQLVGRMRSGPGSGEEDSQVLGVSIEELRRFQCFCAARPQTELLKEYGDEFHPPVAVKRGTPPQILDPSVDERSRTMVVDQVIDEDGGVACQLVRKGLGDEADADVLAYFRSWRFTPATVRGKPTSVVFRLVFHSARSGG